MKKTICEEITKHNILSSLCQAALGICLVSQRGGLSLKKFLFSGGWVGALKRLNQAPSPKTPFMYYTCAGRSWTLERRFAIGRIWRTCWELRHANEINSHRCIIKKLNFTMERTNHGVKHVLPDNYNYTFFRRCQMSDLIIILLQHIIQGPAHGFFLSRSKLILLDN